jgi:hypothetical protein
MNQNPIGAEMVPPNQVTMDRETLDAMVGTYMIVSPNGCCPCCCKNKIYSTMGPLRPAGDAYPMTVGCKSTCCSCLCDIVTAGWHFDLLLAADGSKATATRIIRSGPFGDSNDLVPKSQQTHTLQSYDPVAKVATYSLVGCVFDRDGRQWNSTGTIVKDQRAGTQEITHNVKQGSGVIVNAGLEFNGPKIVLPKVTT